MGRVATVAVVAVRLHAVAGLRVTLDSVIYLLLAAALLAAALSLLPSPWCWLALVPGAVAVGCVRWIERRRG